jgi:hypothetical protein
MGLMGNRKAEAGRVAGSKTAVGMTAMVADTPGNMVAKASMMVVSMVAGTMSGSTLVADTRVDGVAVVGTRVAARTVALQTC